MARTREAVLGLLRRDVYVEEYDRIRELWKRHSIAEDRRDLPGLLSTLTEDCVYELTQTGHPWERHEGAARFYAELLSAFPDVRFDLTDIVIGPQGVFEQADVSGTFKGPWLGQPGLASGWSGRSRSSSRGTATPSCSPASGSGPTGRSCSGRRPEPERDGGRLTPAPS